MQYILNNTSTKHQLARLKISIFISNLILKRHGIFASIGENNNIVLNHSDFTLCIEYCHFLDLFLGVLDGNAELKFGEGYMLGSWKIEKGELKDVLWAFYQILESKNIALKSLRVVQKRNFLLSQTNNPKTSKQNVAHHYDLGNDLFLNFLDSSLEYSSAIFTESNNNFSNLEDAQNHKANLLIDLLNPSKEDKILEIGCGWGSLSRRLKEKAHEVTAISLSAEQIKWCEQKQQNECLFSSSEIEYRLEDYRHHYYSSIEKYDHIISVEMFDHVGKIHHREFFEKVFGMLKPGGTLVLQVLTRPTSGHTTQWINKYIFPGGYIASLKEIQAAFSHTGFSKQDIVLVEYNGTHYSKTLTEWKKRFKTNWKTLKNHGYDEKFYKMWIYYLTASEMVFSRAGFKTIHIKLQKPNPK